MRHWIYNLFVPPPDPKFMLGQCVTSHHLSHSSRVISRKLEQVHFGRRWNEETRGWLYLLIEPIGFWIQEDILKNA